MSISQSSLLKKHRLWQTCGNCSDACMKSANVKMINRPLYSNRKTKMMTIVTLYALFVRFLRHFQVVYRHDIQTDQIEIFFWVHIREKTSISLVNIVFVIRLECVTYISVSHDLSFLSGLVTEYS